MPVFAALAPLPFDGFEVEEYTKVSGEEIDSEEICFLVRLAELETGGVGETGGDCTLTGLVRSAGMGEGVAGVLQEKRGGAGGGEPLLDTGGGESYAFFAARIALRLSSSKPLSISRSRVIHAKAYEELAEEGLVGDGEDELATAEGDLGGSELWRVMRMDPA